MLDVRDVTVAFDGRRVLDAVDLTVADGEIVALLGPSGSGKSTLLRAVAGLQPLDGGQVQWDGRDLASTPPHRRRFGMVFQDAQLFPHLDVGANVAFGLRMQHVAKARRQDLVGELLELVGLAGFEHRSVGTLSGGERQRVALARSLAPEPVLLLLDEPFAALDRDLHDRLVPEVRSLLKGLRTTAVHVTHDHAEATAIGDRTVRLGGG